MACGAYHPTLYYKLIYSPIGILYLNWCATVGLGCSVDVVGVLVLYNTFFYDVHKTPQPFSVIINSWTNFKIELKIVWRGCHYYSGSVWF